MGRDKKTSVGYPIKRRELPPTVFCVVDLSCVAGLSTVKATVRLTVFFFLLPSQHYDNRNARQDAPDSLWPVDSYNRR